MTRTMAVQEKIRKVSGKEIAKRRGQLLSWYDRHTREVPWRVKAGETPDPYSVWLSEIMCQQTTVQAVKVYYEKFLNVWPTVHDLAAAESEDVMAAWAGLGYYARARNLHKCAKIVSEQFGGKFPNTQDALKALPGIGDYTSAAIAAIAFNKPATVVDGNVERVISRLYAIEEPLPHSKKTLKAFAHEFYDGFTDRPGDLAQSFMDLGAGICIPKAPRCMLCPLIDACEGQKKGIAAELPRKIKKGVQPKKHGAIYWITNDNGEVLFHQRPDRGLLGGMLGLPTSDWVKPQDEFSTPKIIKDVHPLNASIFHNFTHFDLELKLHTAKLSGETPADYIWADPATHGDKLPTVFKKAFKACLKQS